MKHRFQVVLPEFPYWRCLQDLQLCLADAIDRAGYQVELASDFSGPGIDIVLGAHVRAVELPRHPVVIYQTELPSSKWWTLGYLQKLESALAVWDAVPGLDYKLPARVRRAVIEPGLMALEPECREKDIDVLFYGSLSERRVRILEGLIDAGINVEAHFNVFGTERDALIDRAKIVIDIKQGESDPDDITRTFYLDSRGACVLSENSPNKLPWATPALLLETCRSLIEDDDARAFLVAHRRSLLRQTDASQALKNLFADEGRFPVAAHA